MRILRTSTAAAMIVAIVLSTAFMAVLCQGATTDADAPSTAVVGPEVLLSLTTLLSGGLDDCPTYNASTCKNGVAAAAAHRRAIAARGTPHVFLSGLDWTSAFSKLHPLDWGVNFDLQQRFGVTAMLTMLSIGDKLFVAPYQPHVGPRPVLENFDIPQAHALRSYLETQIFDPTTKLHLIAARVLYKGLDATAKVAATALFTAKKLGANFVTDTVVLTHDSDPAVFLEKMMTVPLDSDDGGVRQRPTVVAWLFGPPSAPRNINGTWVLGLGLNGAHLNRLRLHRNPSGVVVNVSVITDALAPLSDALRETPEYRADQAALKVETEKARANDRVVGASAGAMPAPQTAAVPSMCLKGECEMGNLWAEAIQNKTGTDFAIFPGPWLGGGGWPAGNVTRRNILETYSFLDSATTATMMGLSVFEMFNHSMAISTFDGSGDRSKEPSRVLTQISGVRVTYDKTRTGADQKRRLVSIEMWDKIEGKYKPLERFRLYTVTTVAYLAFSLIGIKEFLFKKYAGEVGPVVTKHDMHTAIADYLVVHGGAYVPRLQGRLVNSPGAAGDMVAWTQTAAVCQVNTYFNKSLGSCIACPAGSLNSAPHSGEPCVPIVPEDNSLSSTVVIALAAGSVVLLGLIIAVVVFGIFRWRRHRRIRYCPKDAAAPVAAFFVTVRNEVAMREHHGDGADDAIHRIERIVSETAKACECFVARKLGAHFLVVAKDPANAIRCAGEVHRQLETVEWAPMLTHSAVAVKKIAVKARRTKNAGRRRAGSDTSSRHSQGTKHTAVSSIPLSSGEFQREQSVASPAVASPAMSKQKSGASKEWGDSSSARSATSPVTSEQTRQHNKYATTPAIVAPQVSIGVSYGACRIDFDEEVVFYAYSGPVVDGAAAVADVARPGQVLVTEQCVDAAKAASSGVAATQCEMEDFYVKRMTCPASRCEKDVLLLQVNPLGCRSRTFEAPAAKGRHCHTSDEEEAAAGALAAALETAAGGLTSRRVGAVCWAVPALRSPGVFGSRADHARHCEAVLAALQEVAHDARCDLVAALDGVFVAVVNGAAARTAQVATMAAGLGRAGVEAVEEATEHRVAAGVAVGTALAGAVADTVVVAGVTAERAQLLAAAAAGHAEQPAVLVGEELFAELDPHFVLAAADIAVWPMRCQTQRSTTAGASAATKVVLLYSLEEPKPPPDDDEEWLYQFHNATQCNPYAASNAALAAVVSDAPPEPCVDLAASTPVSEVELPLDQAPAAEATATPVAARAGLVRELCSEISAVKKTAEDWGDAVGEFARRRTTELVLPFAPTATRRLGPQRDGSGSPSL